MDLATAFNNLNWLAVLLAAVSAFVLGSIWYAKPVFGARWMKDNGFTDESIAGGNMVKIFGLAFLLSFVAAFFLAMFIGPDARMFGAVAGFMAGFGWVLTFFGINYLYEQKTFALFLINGGYSLTALTLMGLVIGLMQ